MKKKILLASTLVFVLTPVIFTGVALADKHAPVGEQIIVSGDPITFPAGEPFHIQHGFVWFYYINEPVGNGFALSKMTLEVNGVEVKPDYVTTDWGAYPPDLPYKGGIKLFTFNFPDGMTGEVTFVGRYFFTCQSELFAGNVEECDHPTQLIEDPDMMKSLVVVFN